MALISQSSALRIDSSGFGPFLLGLDGTFVVSAEKKKTVCLINKDKIKDAIVLSANHK